MHRSLDDLAYALTSDEKARVVVSSALTSNSPQVISLIGELIEATLLADEQDDIGARCRQTIRQMASLAQGDDQFMAFALVGRTLHTREPEAMAALENFVDVALSRAL